MKKRIICAITIFEVPNVSSVLLHLFQLFKVSFFNSLSGFLFAPSHLFQVILHLAFGNRLVTESTLLDVSDAVIVVQLEGLFGYHFAAI